MSEVEEKSTKKRKITSAKAASSSASIEARDDHSTTSNEGKDDSNNDGEDSNNKRKRSAPTFFHEEQRSGQLARPARFVAHVKITEERLRKPLPTRDAHRFLHFPDFPMFTPNLTPQEVLQAGSFGGTYFRPIYSSITKQHYRDQWQEFPADWFEGLKIPKHVASANYDNGLNTYKVSCGGDLKMWEESGWITEVDPYGWFQWYCRFYLGRRCSDDHR